MILVTGNHRWGTRTNGVRRFGAYTECPAVLVCRTNQHLLIQEPMSDSFQRNAMLIAGEWVDADSKATIDVTNPASGKTIGTVPDAGQVETRRAIEAAKTTFADFRKTGSHERAAMLTRMHDLMIEHRETLAQLLTLEQGKPLAESRGEITIGANYLQWFAEEARRAGGDVIAPTLPGRRSFAMRAPVGVVAAITPWNFPSSMLARKIGPAIAAGCTTVVKPAEKTPYSALAWGVIAEMAGVPSGVVNIVTGDAATIGGELTCHPDVRKLTFTGSTAIGRKLIAQCATTVKRVSMELGGNAPFIVFDDANLTRAIDGAMIAKYRNSGQTCVCTNRFIVQRGVHNAFVQQLTDASNALNVGTGSDDGVEQGPLIDEAAVQKIESLIADARDHGANIVTGGKRHKLGGTWFEPTVITGATPDMRIAREEIFGPVSVVYQFKEEQEAVRIANDTEYGLACYCYTRDLGRAFRMTEALDYGMVGINEGLITAVEAPFGGVKNSGVGIEGGRQGIDEYLDTKYACFGGLED